MDTRSKIITRPSAAELAERFPPGQREIVAIRGRFELLQASLIRQIEQAASGSGQTVFAILAGDGPSNDSLLGERDRAQLLAALRAVDAVVICDQAETDALIAALRPARQIRLDESAASELIADVLRRNKTG
jgi:bifunctional ADP-heptose synthase (sugar kinase/adenylyltransferase)